MVNSGQHFFVALVDRISFTSFKSKYGHQRHFLSSPGLNNLICMLVPSRWEVGLNISKTVELSGEGRRSRSNRRLPLSLLAAPSIFQRSHLLLASVYLRSALMLVLNLASGCIFDLAQNMQISACSSPKIALS